MLCLAHKPKSIEVISPVKVALAVLLCSTAAAFGQTNSDSNSNRPTVEIHHHYHHYSPNSHPSYPGYLSGSDNGHTSGRSPYLSDEGNAYGQTNRENDEAGELVDQPGYDFGPRALPGDRAYLRVIVPMANAKLIYDGHEVPGRGPLRTLLTSRIRPGQRSTYTVIAYWRDLSGISRTSISKGTVQAGDHRTVQFNMTNPDDDNNHDNE